MNNKTEIIGHIAVDAGLCWIGDPCYIMHKETPPNSIGRNWGEFCDNINGVNHKSFNFDLGHEGLGVVCSPGYGDGSYPVIASYNKEGRISKLEIVFIDDNDLHP